MNTFAQGSLNTQPKSVLERLAQTNSGLEVWWDSSPLVFESWVKEMVEIAPEEKKELLEAQLNRVFDAKNPKNSLIRGVTTNPPLSLAAMKHDPERWSAWIANYVKAHPEAEVYEVFWALYKEIVRLGAEKLQPIFENSGYEYGYISAQVDPHHNFDEDIILEQALDLSKIAKNVMIKVPGSKEGVKVIKELTARGIPTNCTSAYVVPQFVAVAEAVLEGLDIARKNGVDLTYWRSVVTDMSVRWENSPAFDESANEAGITLEDNDKRWAGVAIFKNAYKVYRQRAYPSKMLICSVRMGPEVDGVMRTWHLEYTAGANAVFTLPPVYLTKLFTEGDHLDFESHIWDDIPTDVMTRLQKVPYFKKAYDPDGMTIEEFNDHAPLIATWQEFSKATDNMIAFVSEVMEKL